MANQIPNKENLKRFIDTCFDAVNESKAGPIETMNQGQTVLHHLAFNTYMVLISSLCPHSPIKIAEPEEKWQEKEADQNEII